MAKKNPRDKPHRYLMMNRYLLESQAWKSLNATARAVYVHMAMKYYGSNNGRIGYSVRAAAEELKIGLATASRALADLQYRGFIVPKKRGAFSLKVRHASEWRLTVKHVTTNNVTADQAIIAESVTTGAGRNAASPALVAPNSEAPMPILSETRQPDPVGVGGVTKSK